MTALSRIGRSPIPQIQMTRDRATDKGRGAYHLQVGGESDVGTKTKGCCLRDQPEVLAGPSLRNAWLAVSAAPSLIAFCARSLPREEPKAWGFQEHNRVGKF